MKVIENFPELDKLWFFDYFSVNPSWSRGLTIQLRNRINSIDQPFLVASDTGDSKWDVMKIFWPWYGIFLMTVLIYEWCKRWWNLVELAPWEQNPKIINQDALERFYELFWFKQNSLTMRASSMEFTYSQTGVSKIEEIIVGRLKKNKLVYDLVNANKMKQSWVLCFMKTHSLGKREE